MHKQLNDQRGFQFARDFKRYIVGSLIVLGLMASSLPQARSVYAGSYSQHSYVTCQSAGMYESPTGSSRKIREYYYGESIGYRSPATTPGWDVVENWGGAGDNHWGFMLSYCVAH